MYFDRDCSNHDTGNNVSDHFRWAIFGAFGQFLLNINVKEWCYRIQYGALFCCPIPGECADRSMIEFEQVFAKKKCLFHFYNPKSPFLSLPIAAQFSKMTRTGGNPWSKFPRDKPFGTFAAFSGSWGIWFKRNFT